MSFTGYKATSTTIGRAAIGERKDYVYGGTKRTEGEAADSGASGEHNAQRKRDRLRKFEVILGKLSGLSGGDLRYAEVEDVRRAGVLVGVGEKTARTYWRDLLRREESTP